MAILFQVQTCQVQLFRGTDICRVECCFGWFGHFLNHIGLRLPGKHLLSFSIGDTHFYICEAVDRDKRFEDVFGGDIASHIQTDLAEFLHYDMQVLLYGSSKYF